MTKDYIEREAAELALTADVTDLSIEDYISLVSKRIKALPAADVKPVVHGKWIIRGGKFRCSVCDGRALWKDEGGTGGFSYELVQVRSSFCPNCGADMREEQP